MGYAGRCVDMMYLAGYDAVAASGAQLPLDYAEGEFIATSVISTVFVEQQNVVFKEAHQMLFWFETVQSIED